MADGAELVPINNQDVEEAVFAGWEDGKGPQALSREFAIPIRRVEEIIDRCLPAFDARSNLSAFKRELRRLEDLSSKFFALAKRDGSHESGHLFARLNERICAMRGIGPINIRMDPLQVEVAQQPSSHDRIHDAIMNLVNQQPPADREAHNLIGKLGGERALELLKAGSGNGDGAAVPSDVPSADDPEPN
jgi:hypothetical protein